MGENAKRYSLTNCKDFVQGYDNPVDSIRSEHYNRKYLFNEREIRKKRNLSHAFIVNMNIKRYERTARVPRKC